MAENKPISTRYYPKLSDLVDRDKLPKVVQEFIVGDPLDQNKPGILGKFHFRNFQVIKAANGESASYNLELISKERVEKELLGGVVFVLNGDSPANLSAFPIKVKYNWPFLGLIRDASTLDFNLLSILDLLEKAAVVFKMTSEDLLYNALLMLVDPADSSISEYQQFITDVNGHYTPSPSLVLATENLEALKQLIEDPTGLNKKAFQVIYDVYIDDPNPEVRKENLRRCFQIIAPTGIEDYLKQILIPNFSASLELSASIEIPREWAIPLDEDRNPIPQGTSPTDRARFNFATSKLIFDTSKDQPLGLEADLVLNPDDLVLVSLGNTGLIAGIKKLKLDTREDRNIPEIEADGRPIEFKGLYVEECVVEFPPEWNIQTNAGASSPPVIQARNLIMGTTGGVSADILVKGAFEEYFVDGFVKTAKQIKLNFSANRITVVPTTTSGIEAEPIHFTYVPGSRNYYIRDKEDNYYLIDFQGLVTNITAPKGILNFKIGNQSNPDDNLQVSLDAFNLSIRQNVVVNSGCSGTLIIPRNGQDNLVIRCTIDFNDGFLIKAFLPNEQPIVDNAFTTIKLKGLELGRVNDANHFGFAGNAEIKQAWPFLDRFLPNRMAIDKFVYRSDDTLDYTVGLGWKSGTTVTISSEQPTEIVIPIHKDTSKNDKRILSIKALKVVAEKKTNAPADPYLSLAATFIQAQLNIGKVKVELSDLGFESKVSFPDEGGNYGPAQVDVDFIPPKSGKLLVDAGFIKGRGAVFYNEAEGSFDGILELEFTPKPSPETLTSGEKKPDNSNNGGIQLKGIVCLQTKMPDGSKGFSLLIILTAEFDEKPIGMGFTLSGIGGLLGLDRTSNIEFLRNGLRTGALESILFPKDPVENAQKIISDVKSGFPVAQERFIIGPLLKIGWGKPTLINVDLGFFVELPDPVVISLLGVARADLPKDSAGIEPIITFKLAFLAVVDFGKKQFSLDASIYESTFKKSELSGDIAVRLWWGENKLFLLTVGGFHPAFEVPPANLPKFRRLALTIRNDDELKLWVQLYTAVTSNTFQFGAEVFLEAGDNFRAKARFWIDVLFQFNPFYFRASLGVEAGIFKGGKSLLSTYLSVNLEGPSPYRANGRAEFKVFGISAGVSFNKTFGSESNDRFLPAAIWDKIKAELLEAESWESILPGNNNLLVTVKKEDGIRRFHPVGAVSLSQKIAPSNFLLEKFGNTVPDDIRKFKFTSFELKVDGNFEPVSIEPVKDDFAIADFKKLNDDEKLSAPSFIKLENGIATSGFKKLDAPYALSFESSYEMVVLDRDNRTVPILSSLFEVTAREFAIDMAFSTASNVVYSTSNNWQGENRPDFVNLNTPQYTIAKTADLTSYEGTPQWFNSVVEAEAYMMEISGGNSAILADMQIADNYELVL